MNSFELYNPTRLVFGRDSYKNLKNLIPSGSNLMLVFGGGSVKKNGVYEEVISELSSHNITEFWGVEPNPTVQTLEKAKNLALENRVDFLLAVGGGSVIDGTKYLALAIANDVDFWEVIKKGKAKDLDKAVPFGTVLTLSATGSEMNSGSVVSNPETNQKLAFGSPLVFPQFSCLNPRVIESLPKRQLANGIVDAFTHVLEQYLVESSGALLQERMAEAILSTLVEIAPTLVSNPKDEHAQENFMIAATFALNGTLRQGGPYDWSTHMIGHELTAKYGLDHAQTLAVVGPKVWHELSPEKGEKIKQYGKRVWNLDENDPKVIEKTIARTEAFYQSVGMNTSIYDYVGNASDLKDFVNDHFDSRGWNNMAEGGILTRERRQKVLDAIVDNNNASSNS